MCLLVCLALGQASVTSPKTFLGHSVGEDYWLANYRQLADYWRKVDAESDRVQVVSIGKTEEGRDQLMAIISDPANMRQNEHYREMARKMALGTATAEEARTIAAEGKAVIWIDGGLHATEVLGAQQLIETVYRLASREDEETTRILRDCIVLVVHANPDGMDLVSDWYMRKSDPQERSTAGLPRLYQKYIGHDNNRDFYANTQSETINMNRVLYCEWFPQIMYNHHQTAPAGTIIFAPPFRGPFNYHVDPLVEVTTAMVGMAMHTRFIAEGKPGAVMRNAASYQTWWNGGLRTTAYFHNMVGILTEAFGSPNPSRISFNAQRLVPSVDVPFPVEPQEWKFAQSIEYELTANYAILDYASRYRSQLLANSYTMARNAIEKGKKDTWILYPRRIAVAGSMSGVKLPEFRDAKAYVLPSNQVDFPTAIKFANSLILAGVTVHSAKEPFSAGGKTYPQGSIVVRCDQAYRAHVLDMFEPQDYPDDLYYAGGPPIAPYDNAGYTPAFTMGIEFDRILEPFSANLAPITDVKSPQTVSMPEKSDWYMVDHRVNDSFTAINEVLREGGEVFRNEIGFVVRHSESSAKALRGAASRLGVPMRSANPPLPSAQRLGRARIALWDRYGGSMSSGWTRWLLEQFKFDFELIYPPQIDSGALARFDVLILPSDASFSARRTEQGASNDDTIPMEWRARMGSLTSQVSVPKIKEFLQNGGTVVAVRQATAIAHHLSLAVSDHATRSLPRDKYYIPTSVLRTKAADNTPACWGMPENVDVMFDQSPIFDDNSSIKKLLWFEGKKPLRSGWAMGQEHLDGGVAAFEAQVGKGKLLAFGPEITFRAQPHGTFKLLFNALYTDLSR
jgi:hypothetical protein